MSNAISAAKFIERLKNNEACCILDIRTMPEYREMRLKAPVIHVPLSQIDAAHVRPLAANSNQPIYILCRSGTRSTRAIEKLKNMGIENAINVEGGLIACKAVGADIEQGRGSFFLALGRLIGVSLILISIALGALENPAFYILASAIGVGLVVSFITGRCPLGMLLAKLFTKKTPSCACSLKR